MIRFLFFSILAGAPAPATMAWGAENETPKAETPQPPLIRLAPQSSAKPPTPLHYRLLPDSSDLTAGNAAPFWYQAALVQRDAVHKITEEEYKWAESTLPLQKLPLPEVRRLLLRYSSAFRHARLASRREHCDWEQPPLTWLNMGDVLLPHIQSFREIALLLSIQCRLQLSERRFDEAAETLRISFALARHLGKGKTLIECLVGNSIALMMLSRVEEWMQVPGSPNLYWPLSALPQPLVEFQTAFEQELSIVYRSFPELRKLRNNKLTPPEVDAAFGNLFGGFLKRKDRPIPQKLEMALVTAKSYPEARQSLLERGWPEKNVDAMSMKQVTLIYELNEADRLREDIQKCLSLPSWQALPEVTRVEREARATSDSRYNLFMLGMAAYSRMFAARVRLKREIAALRCGEALRLYAAAHEGKSPAKWSDITSVPLPVDPATGKGFDAFYTLKGGRALLNLLPLPGEPMATGRRFEWFVNP